MRYGEEGGKGNRMGMWMGIWEAAVSVAHGRSSQVSVAAHGGRKGTCVVAEVPGPKGGVLLAGLFYGSVCGRVWHSRGLPLPPTRPPAEGATSPGDRKGKGIEDLAVNF